IDKTKFFLDPQERSFCLLILLFFICCLKFFPKLLMHLLRQILYYILPLVPLTSLHNSIYTEHFSDCLPESLCSINNAQKPLFISQATANELLQKVPEDCMVLRPLLNEPKQYLLAFHRYSNRHDDSVLSKTLSIHDDRNNIIPIKFPLHQFLQFPRAGSDVTPCTRRWT